MFVNEVKNFIYLEKLHMDSIEMSENERLRQLWRRPFFTANVASISHLFNIFLRCAPRPGEFCPRVLPQLCKVCPKFSKSAPTFRKLPQFLPLPRSACPDEISSNPATFCRLDQGEV